MSSPKFTLIFFTALSILLTAAFLRLLYILPAFDQRPPKPRKRHEPNNPIHVLVVLGSGGHTAEMLSMLSTLHFSPKIYSHRSYVISEGDAFSAGKAVEFEEGHTAKQGVSTKEMKQDEVGFSIHTVPRARRIHQSLISAPLSSLTCLVASMTLLRRHPHGKPDLLVTNGPATALIVIMANLAMDYFSFLGIADKGTARTRSIYVESWARVRKPSLSCRIIVSLGLCDQVLVQWPQLEEAGWGKYRGVLVR